MANLLIGTSGYDYPEWKGTFYPADLKRKDFLLYYSTVFNALEVNSTFYSMPTSERLISFWERSEGRIRFSIKANRLLTHDISPSWKNDAIDFKNAISPLQEKDVLSAVLFQFPQSFHYTVENRIYLAKLISEFDGFPTVIEFRHREWIKPSVFEGLNERGTGIVFCDMPMCRKAQTSIISNYANDAERRMPQLKNLPDGKTLLPPFMGKNAYIRLHGRNADAWYAHDSCHNGSSRYNYDYSDQELKEFVPVVKEALEKEKQVQMFFNNHPNGSGARNAKRFREMV